MLHRETVSVGDPKLLAALSHAAYGLCTLCTVSVHHLTTYHAYSRYFTVCHAASRRLRFMYAISLCLYATQMCTFLNRIWKGRGSEYFFILPCWPSPSSICSVALLLLHHCLRRFWVVLYRLFPQHGCGTITRTSNAVEGLAAACSWQSIDELLLWNLVSWQKRRKSKKKKPQRDTLYEREIPYFLFAEGLEKKRQSKKRKSRKEADIKTNSRFLISDMHVQSKKYGNFVVLSRFFYIMHSSSQWTCLHYNGHIKKPK